MLSVAFGVYEAEVGSIVGPAIPPVHEVVLVQRFHGRREPGGPVADVVWFVFGAEGVQVAAVLR
jgi:hypothetical protein